MKYPTLTEVTTASHMQLARWNRFLPGPGSNYIGTDQFEQKLDEEVEIMEAVTARLQNMGGITPQISKAIGWGP